MSQKFNHAWIGLCLAMGCGGADDASESAGDTATGGIVTATASASGEASTSGADAGTDDAEGSAGGTADSGGSETGAADGGASLPFACDGFAPPMGEGGDGIVCFYDIDDPEGEPAASLQLSAVDLDGKETVYVQLIFAPWFVDNTYGTEVIDWDDHTFKDLDGSDHALIEMGNIGDEMPQMVLKLDYIDDDDDAPSGFRSQGVWDGDGKMEEGDEAWVFAANSSLSRNLNERGYSTYIEDSPATDADYTPNPATPEWDYRVIYEAWVDASLFNDIERVEACIDSIHASPAKIGDNTVDVFPDECPPGWGCFTTGDCDECTEDSLDPDAPSNCDPGEGFPPVP